jgi:hypothetical protein
MSTFIMIVKILFMVILPATLLFIHTDLNVFYSITFTVIFWMLIEYLSEFILDFYHKLRL